MTAVDSWQPPVKSPRIHTHTPLDYLSAEAGDGVWATAQNKTTGTITKQPGDNPAL